MKYAYEIQPDGPKAVFAFPDETSRVEWVAANPATRGLLNGNSKEVKAALYRDTVILTNAREK